MGENDFAQKTLESNAGVFADVVNVSLYWNSSSDEHNSAKRMKSGKSKMCRVMQRVWDEGYAMGYAKGWAEGYAKARAKVCADSLSLLRELDNEGRQEEIMRAIRDESYFRELMREKRGDGYVL